jgi:hypothetical protein
MLIFSYIVLQNFKSLTLTIQGNYWQREYMHLPKLLNVLQKNIGYLSKIGCKCTLSLDTSNLNKSLHTFSLLGMEGVDIQPLKRPYICGGWLSLKELRVAETRMQYPRWRENKLRFQCWRWIHDVMTRCFSMDREVGYRCILTETEDLSPG